MNIDRAIILAAGQGKRLLPLTETRPKCLLELSGHTLLAWQLMALEAVGVPEAVVVTGFGAEAVEAEVARLALRRIRVRTLHNPFYAAADNLGSCWVARGEFDRGVVLLNGDTLFEAKVAQRLLAAPAAEITLSIDRKAAYDADDMKVLTRGDQLLAVGKTITDYDAESIGFLRLSRDGAARFAAAVQQAMRRPAGLKSWYLSVIDELARTSGCVTAQSIEGLDWGEVDFPQDLSTAVALTERWVKTAEPA